MFKKLKEKITEEVKSSPQRFAEFTQSVSDRLQSNSTADDNFFSIGDDDANTSVNSTETGFASVSLVSPSQETRTRKNSNTSIASDVSFLPRYEAGNMYHLQSDLDASASEMEDNASTSSSQLGHLTKEQIYAAFQKSQMRYHKYRGRYTDLARHYKDLERENNKMKSVLVETQDKAIRRVTELREQCSLEQKAKAHLEGALRDEIDEKNYKINTLKTKIELLQNDDGVHSLVSLEENGQADTLENLTRYLNDARKEIESLNEKMQELKANSIVFQSKEQEYKTKISNLEKDISLFAEREKDTNLKFAQNKMELHNEILSKDAEINNLKKDNESIRKNFEVLENESKTNVNTKLENMQSQNKKLIEKVEDLTQKSNHLENELLKAESYKLEIQELRQSEESQKNEIFALTSSNADLENLVKNAEKQIQELSIENADLKQNSAKEKLEFDKQISNLREDARKGLLSLEPKIREKLQMEYLQKEDELKEEVVHRIEELSSSNNLKETKLQLIQRDDTIKKLSEELVMVKSELSKKLDAYNNLEKGHLELIDDCTKLRNTISNLEKEICSLESYEEKISRLEAHINTLQEESKHFTRILEQKENEIVYLSEENLNLQQILSETTENLRVLEERHEAVRLESTETKLLQLKVQTLEEERTSLLTEFEMERKMFNEMLTSNKELKEKEADIEMLRGLLKKCHEEINHLKESLKEKEHNNVQLYENKLNLEQQVEKLSEKVRIFEEKDEAVNLDKTESALLELKLQKLEEENEKLQHTFELERISFEEYVDHLRKDLCTAEEENSINNATATSETKLKHKLDEIRKLAAAKEKEIVYLSKENLNLQQENNELNGKIRLLEEKEESIQVENTECKLLELKLQKLEEDNHKVAAEFEMERAIFTGLLEHNKDLQEKQMFIDELEEEIRERALEMSKLKEQLAEQKQVNLRLAEEKLSLEQQAAKFREKIRISEERQEAINLDKTECSLLEIKLKKLEDEKQYMLSTFEMERLVFNKAYEDNARTEEKLNQLIEENISIKESIKTEKEKIGKLNMKIKKQVQQFEAINVEKARIIQKLQNENQELRQSNMESEAKLRKFDELYLNNQKLEQEVSDKDNQVSELSKNISNLSERIQKQTLEFNSLLERTKNLDMMLETIHSDNAKILKNEKQRQNELIIKVEELQIDVEDKTNEVENLNCKLKELEEEQKNHELKSKEIKSLHRKLEELQAIEKNYQLLDEEKKIVSDELTRLKVVEAEKISLENNLRQLEIELKGKTSEWKIKDQENNILRGEKDSLLTEITKLHHKIEELHSENNNLKAIASRTAEIDKKLNLLKIENEKLRNENYKVQEEMSELNVRIQQVSSDNRNISDENQNLISDKEELKIQLEYVENEKNSFESTTNELKEENDKLQDSIEEMKRQFSEAQKRNLELSKENIKVNTSDDISKIQQDFYEIKEKCDSLFLENKNLTMEYTKLEEKCNDFSKIKDKLENQISELESQYAEILGEKQLLQDEIQELKTSPLNYQSASSSKLDQLDILKHEKVINISESESSAYLKEIELLHDKLTKYKSLDLTNKSSIEFYENELQKIKNQNDKLNRKLDETLVTLNHCAELSTSTEVEYLKNVLYNYMLGKESLVLARVIAAVCKFDPHQTEIIMQKEQQKQTLLGQLGLI